MATKAQLKNKIDLVVVSALSIITDFQLHSQDDDLSDAIEDLREYISQYEYEQRKDQ